MKNERTTTRTAIELYSAADAAVNTMLKGRISKTAQRIDFDLLNRRATDALARRAADLAADLATMTADRDRATKAAAAALSKAKSTKRTQAERDAQAAIYDRQSAKAARLTATIQSIEAKLSNPMTDRADLTQAAALAYWTATTGRTEPKYKTFEAEALAEAEAAGTPAALSAAAMLKEWASRRAATNAAGREHDSNRKANAYTANKTTRREATAEEVAVWIATVGGTGPEFKRAAQMKRTRESECFQTMEWHEATATKAAMWELVTHYKTTRATASTDTLTEEGHEPTDTTGERAAEQTTAADFVAAILAQVKLTEREAAYITARTSEAAKAAGEAAKAAYFAKRDQIRAQATGEEAHRLNSNSEHLREQATAERAAARAEHEHATAAALGDVDRKTAEAFRRRLFAKVKAAIIDPKHHSDPQTAEEWHYFMGNTRRGADHSRQSRADLVAWTERTTRAAAPVVAWQATGYTAEHEAKAAQAAKVSRIDNTTADNMTAANVAAALYRIKSAGAQNPNSYTAADILKADKKLTEHRQRVQAKAERMSRRKAAGLAAGMPPEVYGLNTTFEMWQNWSNEARAEHRRYLNSL